MSALRPTYDPRTKLYTSPFADVDVENGFVNFADAVMSAPHFHDEVPALTNGNTGATFTFKGLSELVDGVARGLQARGFRQGDVFAVGMPNLPETAPLVLAVLKLGGTVTVFNPIASVEELKKIFSVTGAMFAAVVGPNFMRGITVFENLCATDLQLSCTFVFHGDECNPGTTYQCGPVEHGSSLFMRVAASSAELSPVSTFLGPPNSVAFILFSSGTSGQAKGVRLTHKATIANLMQSGALDTTNTNDTTLVFLPFANAFGLLYALFAGLRKGAHVVTMHRFNVRLCLELIEQYQVTRMPAAPPVIKLLATHPLVDRFDLSSLRLIGSGGSRLESSDRLACLRRWEDKGWGPLSIKEGFGMTELAPVLCINPESMVKPGSVGVLVPNVCVCVVDIESGERLPPGQSGEIWVRGPNQMSGYAGIDTGGIDADGWFHTGDIGYFDQDGCYFITDRLKELIKYKGYQVAPAELERVLLGIPGIVEACVVGVPDPGCGEIPKAYVVTDVGPTSKFRRSVYDEGKLTVTFIMDEVAKVVSPYKKVRLVEFIDAVPKQPSGKLLRRVLKARVGKFGSSDELLSLPKTTGVKCYVARWRARNDELATCIEYCVEVRLPSGECISSWKRFSAFATLHSLLPPESPWVRESAKLLPRSTYFRNTSEAFLNDRRLKLQEYLNAMMAADETSALSDPFVRLFLRISAQKYAIAKALAGVTEEASEETFEVTVQASLKSQTNEILTTVTSKKREWAILAADKKLRLLKVVRKRLASLTHVDWGVDSMAAAGIDMSHPSNHLWLAVEMVTNCATILSQIDGYCETLESIVKHGLAPTVKMKDGKCVVFPSNFTESYFHPLKEWTAEVRFNEAPEQARFYGRNETHRGKTGVVLGAGNAGFLSIIDVLYLLFHEGMTVVCKHASMRSYNQLYFDCLFQPLIELGYVGSIVGESMIGSQLVYDENVDHVHMTGGKATHDIIVWGLGDETQRRNKANGTPVLKKPMTSELGCVTPWVITPGVWSEDELRHHAQQLCVCFIANLGCNCLSPKVVVLPTQDCWPQRAKFLAMLVEEIEAKPLLPPYYPGMHMRYTEMVSAATKQGAQKSVFETAYPPKQYGESFGSRLPWTLLHLPENIHLPEAPSQFSLTHEPFAPILSIASVPGDSGEDFLKNATQFCNSKVMGTLSATLIAHPSIPAEAVEKAIDDLHYGCIGINTWTGRAYAFQAAPWGAPPGENIHDVTTGIGQVRNTHMFENAVKSVIRSPFVHPQHVGCKRPLIGVPEAKATTDFLLHGGLINFMKYAQY